jgi:hypothetical protein
LLHERNKRKLRFELRKVDKLRLRSARGEGAGVAGLILYLPLSPTHTQSHNISVSRSFSLLSLPPLSLSLSLSLSRLPSSAARTHRTQRESLQDLVDGRLARERISFLSLFCHTHTYIHTYTHTYAHQEHGLEGVTGTGQHAEDVCKQATIAKKGKAVLALEQLRGE